MAFQGAILYRVQSFLTPRIDSNFRHLSSCETIGSVPETERVNRQGSLPMQGKSGGAK